MARAVTLTTLQQRVQRRVNLEGATTFLTTAELTDNINESIAHCYDLVRKAFGDDYYRAAYSFSVTSGVSSYALPADFLDVISVDIQLSPTSIISAKRYTERERNIYRWFPTGWVFGQPVFYRLVGGNINFIPNPSGPFTITVNYVPAATKLVNGSDTFDGINGWEEFVVLDAAIKCAIKDQRYDLVQILQGERARQEQRILDLAPERNAGEAERVQDVYVSGGWSSE